MNDERGVSRRGFLRAAAGVGAVAGATGTAGATAEDNESRSSGSGGSELPDFGGYLGSANNGDAVEDVRGTEEVTVEVGAGSQGYAFAPAGIWIDTGTTVNFEWTGEGGAHNVVATEDATADLDSGGAEATTGVAYEYTFEEGGITNYYCNPHQSAGMLGAIAVGEDVPTVTVGGGAGGPTDPEEMGVPFHAHWVGIATLLGIGLTLVLTFFFLKYGETPHSGYPEER
jgi:halocyanin-like protein